MNKFFLLLFLLSGSLVFSQNAESIDEDSADKRDISQNELSIGALNLVAFGALDITYERIINRHSSWAVEGFIQALNRDSEDVSEVYEKDFSLTGKYKYFFGDSYARGFYVHGFSMISNGDYQTDFYYDDSERGGYYEYENYTDLALGFGVGGKFVARGGFLLDLSAGIGRNLLSNSSPTIVGQFNVNLGFRF